MEFPTECPSRVPLNNELTPLRFMGKICGKHPELNGLRIKSSKACVQCHRDYMRKSYKNINAEQIAKKRLKREENARKRLEKEQKRLLAAQKREDEFRGERVVRSDIHEIFDDAVTPLTAKKVNNNDKEVFGEGRNCLNERRFIGEVCKKHPNLKGLRLKSSGTCIGCNRLRTNSWVGEVITVFHEEISAKNKFNNKEWYYYLMLNMKRPDYTYYKEHGIIIYHSKEGKNRYEHYIH